MTYFKNEDGDFWFDLKKVSSIGMVFIRTSPNGELKKCYDVWVEGVKFTFKCNLYPEDEVEKSRKNLVDLIKAANGIPL